LLHKIKKNIEINIIVKLALFKFNKILNSFINFLKIEDNKIKFLLGRIQYKGEIKRPYRKVLDQLKENLKKEEGSKTENKFLIIVKIFCKIERLYWVEIKGLMDLYKKKFLWGKKLIKF